MLQPGHPLYTRFVMHSSVFSALLQRIDKALDLMNDHQSPIGVEWIKRVDGFSTLLHESVQAPDAELAARELRIYLELKALLRDVETFDQQQRARFVGACVDFVLGGTYSCPAA